MNDLVKPVFVVVDDEPKSVELVALLCEDAGFEAIRCADVRCALRAIKEHLKDGRLAGVVSDLVMPGSNDGQDWGGWEVIQSAYTLSPRLALAAYTARFEDYIIKLFKSRAAITTFAIFDKPSQREDLARWLKNQYDRVQIHLSLVLRDASTAKIYNELAPIYSRSDLPILILGESGTGKESLARHIHNESKLAGPFVPVNCGGLEPSVAFAELYGYQQGAFTDATRNEIGFVLKASGYMPSEELRGREEFTQWLRRSNQDLKETFTGDLLLWSSDVARENRGTLFLDEVGSLPPKVMAGLLRILSSGDVLPLGYHGRGVRSYCRIIAATNETRVLESISKGSVQAALQPESSFRHDLYYRLNGAVLHLPPLKDRDPREIGHYFESPFPWQEIGMAQMPVESLAVDLVQELFHSRTDAIAQQYQNGNFRSLRNLLHRAALMANNDSERGPATITMQHMRLAIEHGAITVESSTSDGRIGQDQHLRRKFRDCAIKRDVTLAVNFTRPDLRNEPKRVQMAAAVLDVLLLKREPPDPRKPYYEQQEVEAAIYQGIPGGSTSASSFLNKTLTAEHFKQAAMQYFGLDVNSVSRSETIKDIVQKVRQHVSRAVEPTVDAHI